MAFRLLTIVAVLATISVAQAQIYTWKDASGRTHYSDQPPVGADAKTLRGGARPGYAQPGSDTPAAGGSAPAANGSAPAANASGPATWQDKDRDFKKRQKEKAEADAKAKKEADEKAAKDQRCSQMRNDLAGLTAGGRYARSNANGEKTYLDENQMNAEATRLRNQISQECN